MATAKRKRLSSLSDPFFEKFGFNEPSPYIEQNLSVPSEFVKTGVHCISVYVVRTLAQLPAELPMFLLLHGIWIHRV